MNPELFNTVFWVFFGGVSLWIAWGFIRLFVLPREHPPMARGAAGMKRHSAGGGSHAESVAGLGVIGSSESSLDLAADTGGDAGGDQGSDSGGDSGGGDFSGGGGDSGGGGSSGGW